MTIDTLTVLGFFVIGGIWLPIIWFSIRKAIKSWKRIPRVPRFHCLAFVVGIATLLVVPEADAACPSVTFSLPYTTADVPAQSGSVLDSNGNTIAWSQPDVPPVSSFAVPITFTPATCGTAPPPSISPEGAAIIASANAKASIVTSQGTWTFGPLVADGTHQDYATVYNGTANGSGAIMQITGGALYTLWKGNSHWYKWNGATWIDTGSTGPVQPSGL